MKASAAFAVLASVAARVEDDPLGQVLGLIDDLAVKVAHEGNIEAKSYKKYFEWCDEVNRNGNFEARTAGGRIEKLEAQIADLKANLDTGSAKIEKLGSRVAKLTTDLGDATTIRKSEAEEFKVAEGELVEALDVLKRGINIISKEMEKNPGLIQQRGSDVSKILDSLSSVIDAAGMSATDQRRLASLVQSQEHIEEGDADISAPRAAVYKSQSGGIMDVLDDMREKAEGQLSDLRTAEVSSRHNFEMLKQSLTDELKTSSDAMVEGKKNLASNAEAKAVAEGDLGVAMKTLANAHREVDTVQKNCMRVAADHEATVRSRAAELKVIAEAKQIIVEATSGGDRFFQVGATSMQDQQKLASYEIVTINKLAKVHHSSALSQLAARIKTVVRFSDKPFVKVRGLISDMITKLQGQQDAEASEKVFCDEQMGKTSSEKERLAGVVAKLTSKIDRAVARAEELKDEVREHEESLAALAKEQAQMDDMRRESHADFIAAKGELTKAIAGIQHALKVLREYYTESIAFAQQPDLPELHKKSSGGGESIINLLEVCESDFALELANEETEEASRAEAYEQNTQENKINKVQTQQDAEYKAKEVTALEKTISEETSDGTSSQSSLDAVNDYMQKLEGRCVGKPEAYAERKLRREQEIDGLKEALRVLESETGFVQKRMKPYTRLRGVGILSSTSA